MRSAKIDANRVTVARAIQSALATFHPEELSFLVTTGKFENHFRDKLAFQLKKNHPNSAVLREYTVAKPKRKRFDIIQKQKTKKIATALELKHLIDWSHTLNTKKKYQFFERVYNRDIESLQLLKQNNPEACTYFLVLTFVPIERILEIPEGLKLHKLYRTIKRHNHLFDAFLEQLSRFIQSKCPDMAAVGLKKIATDVGVFYALFYEIR